MTTLKEIMKSLKEIFGQHNLPTRQGAIKGLISTKMAKGTSVHDRASKMTGFINEL